MNFRSGNFCPKLVKSGFLRGSFWNFFSFIFVLVICVLCENLNENEAKLMILGHIQLLRVLTRKSWFLANMRSQLPTTMKFCKNVLHMYTLKANKFQVWTNINKSRLGNFCSKIWKIWGNFKIFFVGGQNLKHFEI